jgi:hypothetical protein
LRIIAHIINHSVVTTIGTTPFNLFRGRLFAPSLNKELISPTEEDNISQEEVEELKLNGLIDRWCRINSQLYPAIRLRLEEIQNRKQKEEIKYGRYKIIPEEFGIKPNEVVMALTKGNQIKLKTTISDTYTGPYRVINRTSTNQYNVKLINGDVIRTFPLEHLRFIPETKPFRVINRKTSNSKKYYLLELENEEQFWVHEDDSYIDFENLYKPKEEPEFKTLQESLIPTEDLDQE